MNLALSAPDPAVAREISRWLRDEVGRPHPDLGRAGPVCPFVVPALKADALTVLEHRWTGPHDVLAMERLIAALVDRFHSRPSRGRTELNALVVVVTGLPRSAWWLIDEAHRGAKHRAVERGYMVGQFHPDCREPSVRNRFFAVNTAPHPLYAVRAMAMHDLLFLHQDPTWFRRYRMLFGHRFGRDARGNEHLRDLYDRTCRRYADLGREPSAPRR